MRKKETQGRSRSSAAYGMGKDMGVYEADLWVVRYP